ncbi:MAG: Dabb family protein [Candidatus Nanopelagicales bacterium]
MLTHVVSFTLADPADAPEAKARIEALGPQIEAIRTITAGVDMLGDPGAAHVVLISTHDDVEGLRAYQEHPVHQEFGAWIRERTAAKTVVDFVA